MFRSPLHRITARSTSRLLGLGLLALFAGAPDAGAADFEAALRSALDLHEDAATLEEQTKALDAFRATAVEHPERWLGHFWTAYEETQIAMLTKRQDETAELDDYLDRAQKHLDRVTELHPSPSDRESSSLATLQALVYNFRAWFDEADAERWRAEARRATERGAAIDPDNPVVLVMLGTALIRRGQDEEDPSLLLAARHLLRSAQAETDRVVDRSKTTYFNSEWIPFWLPRAEEALAANDPDG